MHVLQASRELSAGLTSILNCSDIAAHPRVTCLIAGTNDLAKDMQIRVTSNRHVRRDGMLYALSKMVKPDSVCDHAGKKRMFLICDPSRHGEASARGFCVEMFLIELVYLIFRASNLQCVRMNNLFRLLVITPMK